MIQAQTHGELVAWVQPKDGALFPPDLDTAGVDLDSFIAIQVPRHAGPFALLRAAEWLIGSDPGLYPIERVFGLEFD